ncbi:hypothetical protein [Streptomyces sp. NPDC057580]|uniref:hypothetical protein n=1 Tax=Streptomyces sp. NPDC057580 TaxID=3346173 RepID=UPI0036BFF5E8
MAEHATTGHVAMYRIREPVEESIREWDRLGSASFQWGRGPLIAGVERRLFSFFRPVKGCAAPTALVSPGVLPYRAGSLRGRLVYLDEEPLATSALIAEHTAKLAKTLPPAADVVLPGTPLRTIIPWQDW